MSETDLKRIFDFVNGNEKSYISSLAEAVSIKSVSAFKENRDEVIKMVQWFAEKLKTEKANIQLVNMGEQMFDGISIPFPPILTAELGSDPKKKTILIYGHLDVQPASTCDGWDTEPFILTEKDGKLFGRGSTDGKGPALCWLHAINAFRRLRIEIPVNIKFCFEAMEESGSIGLQDFIEQKKNTFFQNVDFMCISNNHWLGLKKPCLTYGLRGIAYFTIEITCSSKDLHSGIYGGTVYEAMTDLIALLASLIDSKGNILIPGILENILPTSQGEIDHYKTVDFDCDAYLHEIGCKKLYQAKKKEEVLMARWRYPSLSIHGIEGAFTGAGCKTVIPKKVTGKFSIRLVPSQKPEKIEKLVTDYLNEQFSSRNSPNLMKVSMPHFAKPWLVNFKNKNFVAGQRAIKNVFGVDPDMIREGCTIPAAIIFQEVFNKSILLLPIGASDDGAHSQNEKINRSNYINGVKVLASYLIEISK